MGDLAGWPYWKVISITGQSGAGADYQVELEIGDSAGGDFHLEGHCTNFPQDIRITDDDGITLLDHWVEDITADPIVVHVEVKDDLGSNQDIRVYYGKNGETTASNGANTFLLFDDFPGSSIDTGKWTTAGTPVVSGGAVSLSDDDGITSIDTFGFETAVTAKSKADEQDTVFVEMTGGVENKIIVMNSDNVANDDFNNIMLVSKKAEVENIAQNQWTDFRNVYYLYTIKRISSSLTKYSQGSSSNTYTNSDHIPTVDLSASLRVWDSSQESTLIADWIYVRKCIDTEPAFSSAGAEQTAAGAPTGAFYGPLVGPFGGPI